MLSIKVKCKWHPKHILWIQKWKEKIRLRKVETSIILHTVLESIGCSSKTLMDKWIYLIKQEEEKIQVEDIGWSKASNYLTTSILIDC